MRRKRSNRDYNDPFYNRWRKQVYTRDKHCCVLCSSKKRLEAHHIKRWSDFPQLRFDPNNGVTLCRACHRKVTNFENNWEPLFIKIVAKNNGKKKTDT